MGDALACLRAFPPDARQDAGFQINLVQRGKTPDDWKPMKTVGKGAREIRISAADGQYRVVYAVEWKGSVHVLHAFKKKSRRTKQHDIDLARQRFKQIEALNG